MKDDFKKLLGKRIQSVRKAKNFTQDKLAELIGVETPSISYIETGKYSPSAETLQKLSAVLNVEPWELYYFNVLSEDEMKNELLSAWDRNPRLIKVFYSFFKSIEYL